jgi:phage protein U
MFAQLGDIVFQGGFGFEQWNDMEEAIIAQYALFGQKAKPDHTGVGLRQMIIPMRLHQGFVKVREATLQLRQYLQQGSGLTLTWGNGDVEGRFMIARIERTSEFMDPLGNLISVLVVVLLMEVPVDGLLTSKIASSQKEAFAARQLANNPWDLDDPRFKAPPPYVPPPWEQWVATVGKAIRMAGMIEALSYGGRFPYLGQNLGQILGNADANYVLMQELWGGYGSDFDMDDQTTHLTDVRTSIGALQAYNTAGDFVGFATENRNFQGLNNIICF